MDLNGITPVDAYSRTQPTKNTSKMTVHKALPTPKQEGVPLVIPKGPTTAISIPSKVLDPITDALNRTLNSNDTRNSPPEESVQPVLSSQSASDPFSEDPFPEDPFPDLDSEYPPFLFNPQELSLDIPSYFNLKPFDPSKGVKKVGKLMLGDALDFHKVVNSLPVPTEHSITANNFNTNNSNASNNNNNTQPPVTANNGLYPINAPATHSKEHISIKANNSNARSYSATPPPNTNANIRPKPAATHVAPKVNASSVKPVVALVQPKANPPVSYSMIPTVLQKPLDGMSSASLPLSTIEVTSGEVVLKDDYEPMHTGSWIAINELIREDISRLIEVDFQFAGENGAFVINTWKRKGVAMCKVPAIWTVTYRKVDGNIKTVKMLGSMYSDKQFPSNAGVEHKVLWDLYLEVCARNIPVRQAFDPVRREAPFWGKHTAVTSLSPLRASFPLGTRNPTLELFTNKGSCFLPLLIPPKLTFYLGTEIEDCDPKPPTPAKPVPPEILQVLSKDDNFAENVNSLLRAQYTANGGRDLYSEGMIVLNYLKSRLNGYGISYFTGCEGEKGWENLCFTVGRLEDWLNQWLAAGFLADFRKFSDNYFLASDRSFSNMGYMGEEDKKVLPKVMAIKKEEFKYLWERPTVASVQKEIGKWWKGPRYNTRLGDLIWEIRKAQESGVINADRMKILQNQIPALIEGIAWFNYASHKPGNHYYENSLNVYDPSAWAALQGRRAFASNAYTNWQSQPIQLMLNGQHNPYCAIGTQNNLVLAKPRLPCVITQQASTPAISGHYVWMLNERGEFVAPIEKYGILKKAQWLKYS